MWKKMQCIKFNDCRPKRYLAFNKFLQKINGPFMRHSKNHWGGSWGGKTLFICFLLLFPGLTQNLTRMPVSSAPLQMFGVNSSKRNFRSTWLYFDPQYTKRSVDIINHTCIPFLLTSPFNFGLGPQLLWRLRSKLACLGRFLQINKKEKRQRISWENHAGKRLTVVYN